MVARKGSRAISAHEKRNARARSAGFRNYYHYRKETAKPAVSRMLKRAGVEKGRDRYELAALASGVKTLPGRKGSRRREKKAGILSDAIRRAGKNPTRFWENLKSPKRKR